MRKSIQVGTEAGTPLVDPEFPRPFALDKLGAQTAAVEIDARPMEREALAARFDLAELGRLSADLQVDREAAGLVRVSGRLIAEGAQICVVSLEQVPFALDLPISLRFASEDQVQAAGEVSVDAEGEDPPEPIEQGAIDLGEAMAQMLAVALDPFPRAAEAVLDKTEFGPAEGGASATEGLQPVSGRSGEVSPFAKLQRLRLERGDKT